MNRIVVIGAAGSGKSTMAARLACMLGCPFVEPDGLFWDANWTPAPTDVFRARVAAALHGDRWTFGGNYSGVRDIVWGRADTLIWLDYALPVVFWRLLRRSLRRVITREALWNGNRETWRGQFWSRDSLFLFMLQTHARRRRELPIALSGPAYQHLHVLRFRAPRATERWVVNLQVNRNSP
ncbi:MAG TPA: hypothetical protein VFT66_09125 [Roseiflexaceae bacterium]|jgi:adenylate kinase family enzyme|nr:hypothetical protein [Roseiflexaceae bacterium]